MTYPDGIDALVNVNAGDTLAAGGHAARHNSVNTALVEVKDYLGPALADKVAYPTGGSDGDLLAKDGTAAEWIAVPEAGLTFITAESFSAVSSVSINGCFTSDYQNYMLNLNTVGSTVIALLFRLRNSGSDITSGVYSRQILYLQDTTFFNNRLSSQTSGQFAPARTSAIGTRLELFSPQAATVKNYSCTSTDYGMSVVTNANLQSIAGSVNSTTQCDGITILTDTGTITGTIRVYGYKD
jgi:hypothetical protein